MPICDDTSVTDVVPTFTVADADFTVPHAEVTAQRYVPASAAVAEAMVSGADVAPSMGASFFSH